MRPGGWNHEIPALLTVLLAWLRQNVKDLELEPLNPLIHTHDWGCHLPNVKTRPCTANSVRSLLKPVVQHFLAPS